MSTIRFTFEDLCAFFTSNPARLMVGLIATEGEAPENVHEPHIVIKQNGIIKREYRGFAEINGDISLDVYPQGKLLNHYIPRSTRDSRQPFSRVVDIERDLYPKEKLNVDPELCRARLHFDSGELYTRGQFARVSFVDLKTNLPSEYPASMIPSNVGLDVEIPDTGSVVLRFRNGIDDFVFHSGRDYEVGIANRAEAIVSDHFKYFYGIVYPKPEQLWIPISPQGIGQPVPALTPEVYCTPGTFGQTAFDWLISLLSPRPEPPPPKS